MNKQLKLSLTNHFKQQRLVFWYDANASMLDEFNALELEGISKIEVKNNEFSVKYRIMRQELDQKFLLYFAYAKPADRDNWLLDLNLANSMFSSDKYAFVMQEFDWTGTIQKDFVKRHYAFFENKARVDKLKQMLKNDNAVDLENKMLSIVCGSELSLERVLFSLFEELAKDSDRKYEDICRFGLDEHLWKEINTRYKYFSDTPTIKDFLIKILKYNFISHDKSTLSNEAIILISNWRDSAKNKDIYEKLSERLYEELNIKNELEHIGLKDLITLDVFLKIDWKIINELRNGLVNDTISLERAREIIACRETKYWYSSLINLYQAIKYAIELMDSLNKYKLKVDTLEDGSQKYITTLHKVDFYYRKFILYHGRATQNNVLMELYNQIENLYSNNFLLKLNDSWQQAVDNCECWKIDGLNYQRDFYRNEVQPSLNKGQNVFVIISDALRYECGIELNELINREKRYSSSISPMLSTLPSYTQLGMAALLPNKTLTYESHQQTVFVDGISSQGLENRAKILKKYEARSTTISAKEFLKMPSKTEGREFAKKYEVVYIYHNGIDAVGDASKTESKVFEAVEDEFEIILKVLKQIANINRSNAIITSDHGFVYQNMKLAESDFVKSGSYGVAEESSSYVANRRFVLGTELKAENSFKHFTGKQLNIDDNMEVLISKSINRLRVKGAGSQFVHGGASPQEVIVPVIHFNYKKNNTIDYVDVDVVNRVSRITSGQIVISLYQISPVDERFLSRTIRCGFYAKDGKLISNQIKIKFDSNNTEDNNRVKKIQFTFSILADSYKNQDVSLKLEEAITKSEEFRLYKEYSYQMKKAFDSDFDL